MGRNRRVKKRVADRLPTSDAPSAPTPTATGTIDPAPVGLDAPPATPALPLDDTNDDDWGPYDYTDIDPVAREPVAQDVDPPVNPSGPTGGLEATTDAVNWMEANGHADLTDVAVAVTHVVDWLGGEMTDQEFDDLFDGLAADDEDITDGAGPDATTEITAAPTTDTADVIDRFPVNSGWVRSIGYDPASGRLDIDMNGSVYTYTGVPAHVGHGLYDTLNRGGSVGSFVSREIVRGPYTSARAPHLDGTPATLSRCSDCGEFTSTNGIHVCASSSAGQRLTEDPRTYRADDGTHLQITNATAIRRALANGETVTTDITYTDPTTAGTYTADVTIRQNPTGLVVEAGTNLGLTGSEEYDDYSYAHARASEAIQRLVTAPRIRRAIPDLAEARTAVSSDLTASTAAAQASTAAAQAAQAVRPIPGVSYAEDYDAYNRVASTVTQRIRDRQAPVAARPSTAGAVGANRKFGIEIEFVGGNRAQIGRDLHAAGLTNDPSQRYYHSGFRRGDDTSKWRYETDCTVDGEIISPVLDDSPESWSQIAQVIEIMERNGARVDSRRVGMHINVEAHDGDHDAANYDRVVANFHANADTIMRMSSDTLRRSDSADRIIGGAHRGTRWCNPNTVPSSVTSMTNAHGWRGPAFANDHGRGINMAHATGDNPSSDRIEFRTANGSMDLGTIQARVMVARAIVERSFNPPVGTERPTSSQRLGSTRAAHGNGRRAGESAQATASARQFVDSLFDRDEDRTQAMELFAATRWQSAGSGRRSYRGRY